MKTQLLSLACLLALTGPALAQAVESEPLAPFKPYTMSGESDPMALDGPPPAPLNNAPAALPATPPPGADSLSGSDRDMAPQTYDTPYEALPESAPYPAASPYNAPAADAPTALYPNNNVSGLPPRDTSKFENRVFCILNVAFNSAGRGPDAAAGQKVKSYLDSNAGKMTYTRKDGGKDGAYSYCIMIDEHKLRARTYSDLKKIIREAAAPTTLTGQGFDPVSSTKKPFRE